MTQSEKRARRVVLRELDRLLEARRECEGQSPDKAQKTMAEEVCRGVRFPRRG